jgi:diamine N-acetyltransferase
MPPIPQHTPDSPKAESPIVSMSAEKVALGPITDELLPLVVRWRSDFEVTRTLAGRWRLTGLAAVESWFEVCRANEHAFMLYERETMRIIGFSSLMDVDHLMRTAESALVIGEAEFALVIGEKDCWGKGYGTEAARLMLDYAFTWVQLHSVKLRVFGHNERGLRAYTRAGFRLIGRWREAYRLGDRVYDVLLMDCLATEFQSPLLQSLA